MTKNIILGCGIGDLFVLLGRLDDFFNKNPEYTSVRFWMWNHSPKLAKELVDIYSRKGKTVTVMSLDDMKAYLKESLISKNVPLENINKFFIKQARDGVGIQKYIEFMARFFPNMEQWLHISTYEKNKPTFPFKLDVEEYSNDKPYFVIHPYSTQVATEKEQRKWVDSRWAWVMKTMLDYYDQHDVFIIGTKQDKIETNMHGFPKKCIDVRGKFTFEETISLIYGSSGVVGTNSWPTLISAWAGMPTYAQWFVQEQLIHYSYPRKNLDNLVIDRMVVSKTGIESHPTGDVAWEKIRKVL